MTDSSNIKKHKEYEKCEEIEKTYTVNLSYLFFIIYSQTRHVLSYLKKDERKMEAQVTYIFEMIRQLTLTSFSFRVCSNNDFVEGKMN